MSAPGLAIPLAPARARGRRPFPEPPVRVGVFAALGAFALLSYGHLLLYVPGGAPLGILASACAGAALMGASARLGAGRLTALLRGGVLAVSVVAALLAAGVPAHALVPGGWGDLGRGVHHGLDGLRGWLWPYRGREVWVRACVLVAPALALTAAAAIAFWPSRRLHRARRLLALALLVAVYLAGAVTARSSGWRLEGLVLLALTACWLWLPARRSPPGWAPVLWLGVAGAAALGLAPTLAAAPSWVDYRAWDPLPAAAPGAFQWDELYGPNPWRSAATVLRVQESHPRLLRVTSLDRFDGLRFLRSSEPAGDAGLDLPPTLTRRWLVRATITVGALGPGPLADGGGELVQAHWLASSTSSLTFAADGTFSPARAPAAGTVYETLSYDPAPSAGQLRSAGRSFPAEYLPYTSFTLPAPDASALAPVDLAADARGAGDPARSVQAPAPGLSPASEPAAASAVARSPYGPMFALARRLAAHQRSSYDIALAIETYLGRGFTYSEEVPRSRYPLESFLFSTRRGYCQQFSGAMALMLRMDGVPARVGVGFRPEIYEPDEGGWQVRGLDAHAWVEVFFAGIGWVDFDPTPPSATPIRPLGSGSALSKNTLLGSGSGPNGARAAAATLTPGASGHGAGELALLALLLPAGIAVWLGVRLASGRRRLRAALAGDAEGAVSELGFALGRLRGQPPGALTLAALERELHGPAARYLADLRRCRYGCSGGAGTGASGRGELRRALVRGRGLRWRMRALAAMPPGAMRAAAWPGGRQSASRKRPIGPGARASS